MRRLVRRVGRSVRPLAGLLLALAACAPAGPRPVAYDEEPCDFCRMTISDPRFGAEVVTSNGRQHVFDSIECLASFVAARPAREVRGVFVSDWNAPGTLVSVDSVEFRRLRGPAGSPMGKGYVATRRGAVPRGVAEPGPALRWGAILAEASADAR